MAAMGTSGDWDGPLDLTRPGGTMAATGTSGERDGPAVGGYKVRPVSNAHRSAVLQKTLSSGKGVRITKGQAKAIVSGNSPTASRYVRNAKTTLGGSRKGK